MKIQEKYNSETPLIETKYGVVLTDNQGNRYEIKENDNREGFEILCDNANININPYCSNVIYVSAQKR